MINTRSTTQEKELIIIIFKNQSKINIQTGNVMLYNIFNDFELIMDSLKTSDLKCKLLSVLKNFSDSQTTESNKFKEFFNIILNYYEKDDNNDSRAIKSLLILTLSNYLDKSNDTDRKSIIIKFVSIYNN